MDAVGSLAASPMPRERRAVPGGTLGGPCSALHETVHRWRSRHRDREELRRLLATAPHLVRDIGLGVEEAEREASKPFWRA